MKKKLIILTIIIFAIAVSYAFGLHQYISLSYIKSQHEAFKEFYLSHRVLTIAAYFFGYIFLTAISFPGALAMSVLAGGLFGLWWGMALVSFASTIGSAIAFLMSRYLLNELVIQKHEAHLEIFNREIKARGKFYLLALRLNPVIPFFLINIVMGLTPMSVWEFYWVSQIGMLPGTFLYVNAGEQLGQLQSLSGILSPGVFWSLLAVSVFPLIVKELSDYFTRNR